MATVDNSFAVIDADESNNIVLGSSYSWISSWNYFWKFFLKKLEVNKPLKLQ